MPGIGGNERPEPSRGERERVLVLMEPGENRRLLAEWLGESYEVTASDRVDSLDGACDVCLVGPTTFARHVEAITERREREAPAYLPVLLVGPDWGERSVSPKAWDHVDEVIQTPIRKAELRARLEGLLARRRLSRTLEKRENRIRTILETVPDPLFVLDADGRLVGTNPAFSELTGVPESAVGSTLNSIDAFSPEATGVLARLVGGASAESATPTDETPTITYRRPEGTERIAEPRVASLPDEPGQVLFLLRDVTARVERERELERQKERLEAFSDMLAHEIRNPLNVAEGYVRMLTPANEREAEYLQRIRRANDRMARIVEELLAFARLGDWIGTKQSVSIESVAESAWNHVDTGGARVRLDVGELVVVAAPDSVETVFENLFRNAVEHGGRDVTVVVGRIEATNDPATGSAGFYVEDDGRGISVEDRDAVFGSGYTTSDTGTGLGLSLVVRIADAHGWTVELREGAEGGARFEFTGVALAGAE